MAAQKADPTPRDHPGRVIVKNYPPDTSTRDLQIMFEKYGKIDDLFTPKNRENDKPRGFSFLRYRRVEDAEDAIRGMNGREIDGQKLIVEFAHNRGGEGVGSTHRGGRGPPPFRGSRDDSRHRRRSMSPPRRYRSRSSSPRDHWRGNNSGFNKYTEHDEYISHYGPPPPNGPHPPSQYSRFQDGGMMDMPNPSHGMEQHHPHRGPLMGGGNGPPSGGPPRPQMAGRKILLHTPNIPGPPHHPPGGGPGGRPPPQGRQFDGHRDVSSSPYQSHPNQYGGPPNHDDRDSYPPRESYGGPQGRPVDGAYQMSRGGHPQDNYSTPKQSYYDKAPPTQSYQELPPQRDSYPHRAMGGRGYDPGPPPPTRPSDEYYTSSDYPSTINRYQGSEYRDTTGPPSTTNRYQESEYRDNVTGPPSSSNRYQGSEYRETMGLAPYQSSNYVSHDYGGDQSDRPSKSYKDDYNYDVPPPGNYRNQQGTPRPPHQHDPILQQRSVPSYDRSGYPQRNEGGMVPPSSTRKSYEHSSGESRGDGRLYSTQQSPQRRETRFSSGGPRDVGQSGYTSNTAPPPNNSNTTRVDNRLGSLPTTDQYSMSSYSTGYGRSVDNQRSSTVGGGSGPTGGGGKGHRGMPVNTSFVQSQNYTKPGPPF